MFVRKIEPLSFKHHNMLFDAFINIEWDEDLRLLIVSFHVRYTIQIIQSLNIFHSGTQNITILLHLLYQAPKMLVFSLCLGGVLTFFYEIDVMRTQHWLCNGQESEGDIRTC